MGKKVGWRYTLLFAGSNSGSFSPGELAAMSLDLMGASSYLWHWKHNVSHHTYVNLTGHDVDIDVSVLARSTEAAAALPVPAEADVKLKDPSQSRYIGTGKLKLDELVSAVMPLEQINEGFAALRGGEVARQLITFD